MVTEVASSVVRKTAAEEISELFDPGNVTKSNNGRSYRYDETNMLMEDLDGNIRYFGKNPSNYVWLGEYSDSQNTVKKLYRIVGVFGGNLKIITKDSIGDLYFSKTSVNGAYNKFANSDIIKILNPDFEDEASNNSLYWYKQRGTCSGYECAFTLNGLDSTVRTKILKTDWYLGGNNDSSSTFPDQFYNLERAGDSIKAYVGLMYPSDYGYAANFNNCTVNIYNYNNSNCTGNNWLYTSGVYTWTITPRTGSTTNIWYIYNTGYLRDRSASSYRSAVRPVFYLKSDVYIEDGIGTEQRPFKIS